MRKELRYGLLRYGLIVLGLCIIPAIGYAWPWSTDMMNQPSVKPQETVNGKLFSFPKRSVPVTGFATKVADREASKNMVNPIAVSPHSLKVGQQLFNIYCAACHGLTGKGVAGPAGDAPISLLMGAADLTSDYVQKDLSAGWLWGTITFGSVIMPAYGVVGEGGGSNDLSVEERWHVINYLRNGLTKQPTSVARH